MEFVINHEQLIEFIYIGASEPIKQKLRSLSEEELLEFLIHHYPTLESKIMEIVHRREDETLH